MVGFVFFLLFVWTKNGENESTSKAQIIIDEKPSLYVLIVFENKPNTFFFLDKSPILYQVSVIRI